MKTEENRKYYRYECNKVVVCSSPGQSEELIGILRDVSDIGVKLCIPTKIIKEGSLIQLKLDQDYHFEVVSVGIHNNCENEYGMKILSMEENNFIKWARKQQIELIRKQRTYKTYSI